MKKLFLLFALVLTVCSTAMAETLTTESAVGTIGTLDGREAMVVDLGGTIGKVAVATRNVGAESVYAQGSSFNLKDADDPSMTGLTDGWYIPSDAEMDALMDINHLALANDAEVRAVWNVTETSALSIPLVNSSDCGYLSRCTKEEGVSWTSYKPYIKDEELSIDNGYYTSYEGDSESTFLIRPFHKLLTTYTDDDGVSYVYPVYNYPDYAGSGIKEWKTGTADAIEVTSSTERVTWGEAGKETWYVVQGEDVQLSAGAICAGHVNLILADGAKLTATGEGEQAGIEVSGGNSLAIYGQTEQSGQLEAKGGSLAAAIGGGLNGSGSNITINGGTVTANGNFGAGIGGGYQGNGSNITINGGTVTANGDINAAGIGGGYQGNGSNITINGGTVTANAGVNAAGIGGGYQGNGSNITINGGTVTANGGSKAAGIGGGAGGSARSIYVSTSLRITAGEIDFLAEETGWYRDNSDIATWLAGLHYVAIEPAPTPAPVSVTYIDENGEEKTANAYEIDKNMPFPATLGTDNTTSWYVVTGEGVQFRQGTRCYGEVHLILADGAKLTATGLEQQDGAGIQAMFGCNSITIYGQSNQSGQLIANGGVGNMPTFDDLSFIQGSPGICGAFMDEFCDITINGGIITATGGACCAGIGAGNGNRGSDITINGGTVTASGGFGGAGIGGGMHDTASNITINGGTVTATGGKDAAGIGGYEGNIFVSPILTLKAGSTENPTDVIENTGGDLAGKLGKYVTVSDAVCNITANQDPNNKKHYYSTFYSGKKAYSVPSGVTAYTGAVDGSVLKLTAITGGIIPAGEAVILRQTSEDTTEGKKKFALTATTTTATKSTDNKLSGTDIPMTLGASDYALSLGQNGVGFYLWNGKSIDAHKAYLTLYESNDAKALVFDFEDEPTGIEESLTPALSEGEGAAYNLNGVRVDDSYKGIVIKNGKKIYQK